MDDGEQGPKEIFAISASTRFSFDKSRAQIPHHRFGTAVRRLLSILCSFLQIASLGFGRNGDSSRILKAFALPPIILDILAGLSSNLPRAHLTLIHGKKNISE